jgi:transposase-like protein
LHRFALNCTRQSRKLSIKRRERTQRLQAPFFLLTIDCPKGQISTFMVRLFTALCKSYFKELTENQIFQEATNGYKHFGEACPKCRATGKLSEYGDYSRNLTSYEDNHIIDNEIRPLRFLCSSCNTTHALLPDNIIPYSPYSLLFMLSALIAYYERTGTVADVCNQFKIAVSTIYEWIERISLYKDLMLGALFSRKRREHSFMLDLFNSNGLSEILRGFYRKYGFSFMQNRSARTARSHPT